MKSMNLSAQSTFLALAATESPSNQPIAPSFGTTNSRGLGRTEAPTDPADSALFRHDEIDRQLEGLLRAGRRAAPIRRDVEILGRQMLVPLVLGGPEGLELGLEGQQLLLDLVEIGGIVRVLPRGDGAEGHCLHRIVAPAHMAGIGG